MTGYSARYSDKWTAEAKRWKGPNGKRRKGRAKKWSDHIVATAGKESIKTAQDIDNHSRKI